MRITRVQVNANTDFTSPTVRLPYNSPNTAGNMGVAWCYVENGTIPLALSDENGNAWCLINSATQTLNSCGVFVCGSLAGGPNTVVAPFGCVSSPDVVTPTLHIYEYAVSQPVALLAMQPSWNDELSFEFNYSTWFYAPFNDGALVDQTVGVFLFVSDSNPEHGWTATAPSSIGAMSSGADISNVSGDAIVDNGGSQTSFTCEFDTNAVSPPPYNCVRVGFLMAAL